MAAGATSILRLFEQDTIKFKGNPHIGAYLGLGESSSYKIVYWKFKATASSSKTEIVVGRCDEGEQSSTWSTVIMRDCYRSGVLPTRRYRTLLSTGHSILWARPLDGVSQLDPSGRAFFLSVGRNVSRPCDCGTLYVCPGERSRICRYAPIASLRAPSGPFHNHLDFLHNFSIIQSHFF